MTVYPPLISSPKLAFTSVVPEVSTLVPEIFQNPSVPSNGTVNVEVQTLPLG